MPKGKQIHLVMRDMLFLTWAVQPEAVREMIDARLELDTKIDSEGRVIAFMSAVCFRVAEVRSSVLPLPRLNFEQVNCRAYVKAGEIPAVFFLDMKVNSRMITTLTNFLGVPIRYEDIDIATAPGDNGSLSYAVQSAGLRARVVIGEPEDGNAPAGNMEPGFVTDRLVGYAGKGDNMFKIEIDQPGLNTIGGRVESVEGQRLEELRLLTADQSSQPYSALYVRETVFGTDMPTRNSGLV